MNRSASHVQLLQQIENEPVPAAQKDLFQVIVINPDQTMNLKKIKKFPIDTIAEKNSILWFWVTNVNLFEAFGVIKTWGFEYSAKKAEIKDYGREVEIFSLE